MSSDHNSQDLTDSPADHSLLHASGGSDELAFDSHDGPSRRLISPPSFTERSHLSVGSDLALELSLEERLADRFPVRRTSAAARAFASRRQGQRQPRTSSVVRRRRRHTLAAEVSHLHDMNCEFMFEGDDEEDQNQSTGALTHRSAQSMPLPETISLLTSSMHALSSSSESTTGSNANDYVAGHSQHNLETHQDYQWHSDDDVAASHQNNRSVDDFDGNHPHWLRDEKDGNNDSDEDEGDEEEEDEDHSSLSSHNLAPAPENDAELSEAIDIRRSLIQAQARESTAKLSQALTGLWSAINTSQREAGQSLRAAREQQRSLEEQAWEANEKLREAERCIEEMKRKYKALEKQNKKLSSKVNQLQAENIKLADDKSTSEAEFQEQMSNMVNMSLQTEQDYKHMVAERDLRISQLEEEAIQLSETLIEVEGRAEAEMRRRTWSEVSHSRDSVDLGSLSSPGGPSTSEREEALSYLESPFANTSQKEAAARVEGAAKAGAEVSASENISSPNATEVRVGIFRGRIPPLGGGNNPKKTKKDYGLESLVTSKADSMRYLASPSACSTREEDRMTGEDEGLHYV